MADDPATNQIEMDTAGLYVEENFTDRRIGSLQRLSPVTADGSPDASRPVLFVGQTQVMTPAGALPLNFEIPATTLADAIAQFGNLARQALNDTMKRLEEMRREQASSLIVPGAGGGIPGAGGGIPGAGGAPGGGIQLP